MARLWQACRSGSHKSHVGSKRGEPVATLRSKGQIGICENIPVAEKYKKESLKNASSSKREKTGVGSNRTGECSCWNRHTPTDMPAAFIRGGGQAVQPGLLKLIRLETASITIS